MREFEGLVWELVTGAGGRVVKLIGDEAMFVIEDAAAACDVATRLVDSAPQPVRVGWPKGPCTPSMATTTARLSTWPPA